MVTVRLMSYAWVPEDEICIEGVQNGLDYRFEYANIVVQSFSAVYTPSP